MTKAINKVNSSKGNRVNVRKVSRDKTDSSRPRVNKASRVRRASNKASKDSKHKPVRAIDNRVNSRDSRAKVNKVSNRASWPTLVSKDNNKASNRDNNKASRGRDSTVDRASRRR